MNFTEAVGLSYQYGSQTSIIERLNLFNRVAKSPKGDVAEIGSATGGTTILLSFAAEAVGKHVYSIDPYPEHLEGVAKCYDHGGMKHYKDLFKANILDTRNNVTQYNEDLAECVDKLPPLSVVFIDGLHEFESVKREIELIYPKIVSGGTLAIHDILWEKGQSSDSDQGAVRHAIGLMTNDLFGGVEIIDNNMIIGTKI